MSQCLLSDFTEILEFLLNMLFHSNLLKKSLLLTGITVLSYIAFGVKEAKSEHPSCIQLTNPRIGDTCYTEVSYNARIENQKAPQTFEFPHVASRGFVIIDTKDLQESRLGTTSGPHITVIRPGTAIQIRQAYQQAYQDFNDFFLRIQAEARDKGISSGGLLDIRQRTEQQFRNAINSLTQIQSNSEAIVIKGSAQAQWRGIEPFSWYISGGTLRGKIRVYQRYVGKPEDANYILSNAKNQILSIVRQNQGANPTSPPAPSSFGGQNQGTYPTSPSASGSFGAIAHSSSTGKRSWAWGFNNQQAAVSRAIQECGIADCRGSWFSNSFAALAEANDRAWSAAQGYTQEQAQQNALYNCQQQSNNPATCRVVLVVHSKNGVVLQR